MPLSVGARVGPYEILSPIGAGGMGDVYSARDTHVACTTLELQVSAECRKTMGPVSQ